LGSQEKMVRPFASAEAARAYVFGLKIEGPSFELPIAEGFTFAGLPDESGAGMALVVEAIIAQGYEPHGFDQRQGFKLYRYVPLK
jgi:hypothetical protein